MDIEEAKRLAQERAKRNAIKLGVPNSVKPSNVNTSDRPDLTTFDDLMEGYLTGTAYLTSGMAFDIQTLSPGDLVIVVGTPLVKLLMDQGAKIEEASTVDDLNQAIQAMGNEEQEEVYKSPDFRDIMINAICRSVISINFVNKRATQCDSSRKEVSVIDRLSELDRFELFMQIMAIATTPQDIDDIASFPPTDEEPENET